MKDRYLRCVLSGFVFFVLMGENLAPSFSWDELLDYKNLKDRLIKAHWTDTPMEWGEQVTGVKTRLRTDEKVIALTLNACGAKDDGYDAELIEYLKKERIPAALFISGDWLDKNQKVFRELADNPLFEIANHGLKCKPASVTGRSAFRESGTRDVGDLVDEIELAGQKIFSAIGRRSKYYRSGSGFYDEVAVRVAHDLGYEVVGFDIQGDKRASFPKLRIKAALLNAKPGSIIVCLMNHPEKDTAAGVKLAVPELKARGFKFVLLSDYQLE